MGRRSAAWGLAVALALAGCGGSSREAQRTAAQPITSPPHGGRGIELGGGARAEVVVDGTGMIVVRLYDAAWRLQDPAGKTVEVEIATPDGAARTLPAEAMGVGEAAHFMVPMDEAVVAHVREQGSYKITVHAVVRGKSIQGSTNVTGLATGGQGM